MAYLENRQVQIPLEEVTTSWNTAGAPGMIL